MSDNTVDYSDSRVDAGGDKAYDSSSYGTTTGDLTEGVKPPSGDFGSGSANTDTSNTAGQSTQASSGTGSAGQAYGENEGQAGQLGGNGGTSASASVAPTENKEMSSDDARKAQGYTKTGDMNPEIGG